MNARSNRAEVRNPIISMPAMSALRDHAAAPELRALLLDVQADARSRAEKAWRTHKAPMALYWKAVSVYAGHIARGLRK